MVTNSKSSRKKLSTILQNNPSLANRVKKVVRFGASIKSSEYHITNACNIRCEGCWFFEKGYDKQTKENMSKSNLKDFLSNEVEHRKINTALLIGGEPTLFPDRVAAYVDAFKNVTVSTNGIQRLPVNGFEEVTIAITLFGVGDIDDKLRGIKPNGKRFTGLFQKALKNYHYDRRAGFVIALSEGCESDLPDAIKQISDNGNRAVFNFYSRYGTDNPKYLADKERLLNAALEVQSQYPDVVKSHPYYIRTLIEGHSHFGKFGYEVCPSISIDHPDNSARLRNGNRYLPGFNTWSADLETLKLCCTSGECLSCRDSQAITSWILVNMDKFIDSEEQLATWLEISENYWSQFIWSPYHPDYYEGKKSGNSNHISLVEVNA